MSSFANLSENVSPAIVAAPVIGLNPEPSPAARHIGREVAHELNNILTIIRCYTEELLAVHSNDPHLQRDLKLISENAQRAAAVIRTARAPRN
jgi:signal transduction histidine kinase